MLINIQFLRFAAAMLVVLYHTAPYLPASDAAFRGLFTLGASIGFAGVDIFFVISGFIMAVTTMDQRGGRDSSEFARRRVARIYSGYWPFFLIAWAVIAWTHPGHYRESHLVASFFLWPQPLNHILLMVTWTLSFELYFYLLFALLLWWTPTGWRMRICATVMLCLTVFNAWRHWVLDSFGPDHLLLLPFWDQFLTSPFILEFFAGAVLAYWLARRPHGPGWTWLLSGVALFLATGWINNHVYGGNIEQGYHVVPRVALFGAASLMIMAGVVRLERRGRTAHARFSLLAGGASYATYLAHIPILATAQQLGLGRWAQQQPFGLAAVVYCALMLLILVFSMVFYRKIERPLHYRFRSWLSVGHA